MNKFNTNTKYISLKYGGEMQCNYIKIIHKLTNLKKNESISFYENIANDKILN